MLVPVTGQATQIPLLAFCSSTLCLLHNREKEKLHLPQDVRLHRQKLNLRKDLKLLIMVEELTARHSVCMSNCTRCTKWIVMMHLPFSMQPFKFQLTFLWPGHFQFKCSSASAEIKYFTHF